jgi:2-polyprenyl-3-methyl-5-hydroxy-6-metoxy-1,4-benzoquinol methylase
MKPHSLNEREEELDVFFGIINRFIGYFTRDSIQHTANDTTTEYPFVPMDTRQAYDQVKLAHSLVSLKNPTFIDVGCGIGNIMLMAELMGFQAYGIEKDPYPFEIAKKLMGHESVSQDDIWEFERFAEFDVIYYFRPFSEKSLQEKFEKLMEEQLRPGGILIANRKMNMDIDDNPDFTRIDEMMPVWQKKG